MLVSIAFSEIRHASLLSMWQWQAINMLVLDFHPRHGLQGRLERLHVVNMMAEALISRSLSPKATIAHCPCASGEVVYIFLDSIFTH